MQVSVPTDSSPLQRLLQIMAALRDPESGCPWDLKQDFASIVPHTIEEAYEVADAIAKGEPQAIQDELGDLLFQVVFYAQLGREQGWFGFDDIAAGVGDKLIRRHPHVFATGADGMTAEAVKEQWEAIKREERAEKDASASVFTDVPANLPALLQAVKIQKRCRSVGFDWDDIRPVLDKVREEVDEVQAELDAAQLDEDKLAEEIGDLLFSVVNLARHAKVNPESALRAANQKFIHRFNAVERQAEAAQRSLADFSLVELETFWQLAKQS
ncbi:nucleoside triphosphate pyrophosphohydrolase [Aliidiomarina soli]|uniref:Nucleoside triphosphate pyrophosphohydrolase n=1 Tax=Aliidiomarina soli TaxID=1928574 RepID=A0A432WLP8_9GAMM|nr:nucleoside triphosphate pyrophosphohydrolase [Aliidiomarina soli]RUO34742.1 nucleoside triphosphate pyrophosphohydrolase [Aliidiomarina soli]